MSSSPLDSLRVDGPRLQQRLAALAEIGSIPDTAGAARLALTDEDRAGRDLVVGWMRELGLTVSIDAIGNVVALRPGREDLPPVMTGSHIDTVRTGGRYDGNLGVLAGLEVLETLEQHGVTTRRPLAVAFFTNEEGARFAPDMLGSLVYAGGLSVEDAYDVIGIDGSRLGDELARIGYVGSAPCPGPAPHAFVELHIEQGPVLEEQDTTIGVVTGVQGISWTEITIEGQSNHAGTTPMRLRRVAGYVAAEVAVFARRLAAELGDPQVATVGAIDLHPNLVNVVAARATLTVDLRNTDDDVLREAERRLQVRLDELAQQEGVSISTRTLSRFDPVDFEDRLLDLVEQTAKEQGHSTRRMPSGAGHDAQMLARLCPTAMIFTPSRNGISHNPAEHTDPEQIAAGADVLCQVLLRLAEEEL